jgi:hypothetical protein
MTAVHVNVCPYRYEATAGGQTCDALNYLSGGIVRHLHAHEGNEEEWQRLINMQEEHNKHEIHHDREHNPFLSCSVKSAVDSEECKLGGLINGHAYSVLCIVETLDGHRLLNLRNPWGSFEWNGDFSDGSDKWTPKLKAEVGADDSEGDDGSFWMCWSDFCKYFDEVGVCDPMFVPKTLLEEGEDFPEKCHTHIKTVGSEWKSGVNAGGRPGFSLATHSESTTFKYNPTFSIKADVDKLILQMYQPDHRGSHDPIPWTDMYLRTPLPARRPACSNAGTQCEARGGYICREVRAGSLAVSQLRASVCCVQVPLSGRSL